VKTWASGLFTKPTTKRFIEEIENQHNRIAMTKQEMDTRQSIFDAWYSSVQERLDNWSITISDSLKDQLDYSQASLIAVERYLLEKFDNPMAGYDPNNEVELDAIATYIGEVSIRNLPGTEWYVWIDQSLRSTDATNPAVKVPNVTSHDVRGMIPYVLNVRTGNEFINTFEFLKKRINAMASEKPTADNITVTIENRGYAYQYMFLLTDPKYTLRQLQTWLETCYQKKIAVQKASLELPLPSHLLLHLGTYRFHFIMSDEDWVAQESAEMADNYRGSAVSKDQIRQCASRIEFYGDEDPQMDYFNEQFSLLQQLKDEPGLLIFDYLNNQFIQEM